VAGVDLKAEAIVDVDATNDQGELLIRNIRPWRSPKRGGKDDGLGTGTGTGTGTGITEQIRMENLDFHFIS
jgi:hypothetical protein